MDASERHERQSAAASVTASGMNTPKHRARMSSGAVINGPRGVSPLRPSTPSRGAGAEAHARMITSMGHQNIW